MEQEDEPRLKGNASLDRADTDKAKKAENKKGLGVGGGMGKHKNVGTKAKNASSSEEVHWNHEEKWGYKGWLRWDEVATRWRGFSKSSKGGCGGCLERGVHLRGGHEGGGGITEDEGELWERTSGFQHSVSQLGCRQGWLSCEQQQGR